MLLLGAIVIWIVGRWLISLAKRLLVRALKTKHIDEDPAPDVEIVDFTLAGPVLAVRPYTHTDHYWQVYFDTNKAIREEFGNAGFPAPQTHYALNKPA